MTGRRASTGRGGHAARQYTRDVPISDLLTQDENLEIGVARMNQEDRFRMLRVASQMACASILAAGRRAGLNERSIRSPRCPG